MKILVVSNLYPPNVVGGYERLCADVVQALGRLGHEITVLTSDHGPAVRTPDPIPIHRKLRLLADAADVYRPFEASPEQRGAIEAANADVLSRTLADERPDLVFVWNLFFLGPRMLDALDASIAPCVLFLTDNWLIAARTPDRIGAFFADHVHGAIPFRPGAPPAPDQLLRHSAIFSAAFVKQLYEHCGYAFRDSTIVHNGVSLPLPAEQPPISRRELRRPDELRLLFAGRLVDVKGPQDAVAALPLIQAALPPGRTARLTLSGDALDRVFHADLLRRIEGSGLSDRITIVPSRSAPEMAGLFEEHDIYLFPSRYEPFALTLIHALAAGIPTVGSDAGGTPEILLEGRTGLLFAAGDSTHLSRRVLELADDGERRQRLALRARRLANRFGFDRMVAGLEWTLKRVA